MKKSLKRLITIALIFVGLIVAMMWCTSQMLSGNDSFTEEETTTIDSTTTHTNIPDSVPQAYDAPEVSSIDQDLEYPDLVQVILKEIAINTIKETNLPKEVKVNAAKDLYRKLQVFHVEYTIDQEISALLNRVAGYSINYEVLDSLNQSRFNTNESYRMKMSSLLLKK